MKHPLTKEEFDSIYSRVPRLCVEAIVQTSHGIVLSRRTDPPAVGQWHIPGGTVIKGERLRDTVIRIVREELCLQEHQISTPEMVGVIEYDFSSEQYDGFPVGIAFVVHSEEEPRIGRSASDVKCFSVLPKDMIPEQRYFLEKHDLLSV